MVNGVGSGSGMGRAAIEAALKRQTEAMNKLHDRMENMSGGRTSESPGFKDSMNAVEGLKSLDGEVKKADELAQKLITGEVSEPD